MTLFFKNEGPMLRYVLGVFCIDDLNPSATIRWRMSRWELFKVGLRCIWAALLG